MTDKLNPGDLFPSLKLYFLNGDSLIIPEGLDSPMTLALFYRGHWWPYCRRLLAGYEARREAFAEQGVRIIAGSVDNKEKTAAVMKDLNFPVAINMSKSDGETIGAWWEDNRQIIQPSEFLLSGSGKVMISVYSNGPVGRMDPEETLSLIKYLNEQRAKSEALS